MTSINMDDETGLSNVLLLDTYTKGSSNKTEHMLHCLISAIYLITASKKLGN